METGNLKHLLPKIVEYDNQKLIIAFDYLTEAYSDAIGKNPFRGFLEKETGKIKHINKIQGMQACYDLLLLGQNDALGLLKNFGINLNNNTQKEREQLKSLINGENTKFNRRLKRDSGTPIQKPSTWMDRMVNMEEHLPTHKIDEDMTLERFVSLEKKIEENIARQKALANKKGKR